MPSNTSIPDTCLDTNNSSNQEGANNFEEIKAVSESGSEIDDVVSSPFQVNIFLVIQILLFKLLFQATAGFSYNVGVNYEKCTFEPDINITLDNP